ncbi:MAG: HepT-like ribonuclease domain-containing protein [Pseudomonadota bacterium]
MTDIIEAIERINSVLANVSLDAFESDWQRQWLVERGIEIVSEASRHLPDDLKARNPEIPWQKVAGIGNVLRHNYESIAAAILWKLAQADLPTLEKACRSELAAEHGRERR